MPVDSEAAGKTDKENKHKLDLGNLADAPGQRMKELVNLDAFKNSISNVCQLWLGGLPAPPRRYEQWRSKLVQQEKISFVETPSTISTTTTSHNSSTIQTNSRSTLINEAKSSGAESAPSSSHHVSFKRNRRKEPHELLEDMHKHTFDPLPE
jgi:hypothetical protein